MQQPAPVSAPAAAQHTLARRSSAQLAFGGERAIREAATYYDEDIQHTSTHIIVRDTVNGRLVKLTNGELTSYSVRQLNKMVSGFPRQTITKLKQRRRTLKNRGYAQNCRHKRLDQKNKLERQNAQLRDENARLSHLVRDLQHRLAKQAVELDSLRRQLALSGGGGGGGGAEQHLMRPQPGQTGP